jgi:hypothetical protein
MITREGYSMQADVTLGVIIAVLAPLYGAIITMLFCLQTYTALQTRNYNRIITARDRVIRRYDTNALTYTAITGLCALLRVSTITRNSHHATPRFCRVNHHFHIGKHQYDVRDSYDGVRVEHRFARAVPALFLQALHLLKLCTSPSRSEKLSIARSAASYQQTNTKKEKI